MATITAMTQVNTASDVPAPAYPVIPAGALAAAYGSGATAGSGQNIQPGTASGIVAGWNQNVAQTEYMTALIGGIGVLQGLALTVTDSPPSVSVAPGLASMLGFVELATAQSVTLASGTNYIYLMQSGSVQVMTGTLAAPSTTQAYVYLGAVVVTGGVAAAADTAGVWRPKGLAYRQTADAAAPGDTPAVGTMIVTKTAGGLYLWTGTEHIALGAGAGGSFYWGTATYSSSNATTHDNYRPNTAGRVHLTATDIANIDDANTKADAHDLVLLTATATAGQVLTIGTPGTAAAWANPASLQPARRKITTITATGAIASTAEYVRLNAGGGNLTATLPDAPAAYDSTAGGRIIIVKRIDTGTNVCNLQGVSGQTIDGTNLLSLDVRQCLTLISSGAGWEVIATNPASIGGGGTVQWL